MIAARAKMARKAPCSRYLYFASVHCLTSMIVRLLTNIAPIQSPNAMMKMFLLNANAPITPSKEKLASNTSRYKNNDNQILWMLVIPHFGVCNMLAIPSINTNKMIHRMLATKNERFSFAGRKLPMMYTTIIVTIISIDFSAHIFWRYLSMYQNRCVSFSVSKKKLSATKSRNDPPNPAMVMCEAVSIVAYWLGSKIARLKAARGLIPPTIATMIKGKIILMPNTAMAIPRVKNLCCHLASIFLSTVALTTALSNDKETSKIHKMMTMNTVCNPFGIFNVFPAHRKNAIPIAMIVKMMEPLKCFKFRI